MFETGYVLDYLAAKAFLNLTVEQQAAVAVQAAHIPGGNASFSTVYSDVSVEELKQMGLKVSRPVGKQDLHPKSHKGFHRKNKHCDGRKLWI